MKVLISPVCVDEARAACEGGADIIDIKNVKEGSLGASFPWVIREIVQALGPRDDVTFSATLGDLPDKPGTASLAALGAAASGARYIKAGLFGVSTYDRALDLLQAVVRACRDYDPAIRIMAAGYADYRRIDGISPETLVRVARHAQADGVMLDTAIKDGTSLFDALSPGELDEFVDRGHAGGCEVAVAGNLKRDDLVRLERLGPDIVGVRGCVCRSGERTAQIDVELVREFTRAAKSLSNAGQVSQPAGIQAE